MRFGRFALLVGLVVFATGAIYVFAYRTDGGWAKSWQATASAEVAAATARTSKPGDAPSRQPDLSQEERAVRHIDALVATGEIGRARDAAEDFLRRYPTSGYCQHIETLTGVHPRPPIPGE